MNYLSTLAVVLGIASALISINEFIKKGSWRPGVAYSVAAVVLIVAAVVVANLPSPSGSKASGTTSVLNTSTSQAGIGITTTPTQVSSTQAPSPIPSPTPTSPPRPGTVLYQADQSWSGWSGSKDWQIANRMLVNNGTALLGGPTIVAPYQANVSDYALEANIQVVHWNGCCISEWAMVVRTSSNGNDWQGYSVGDDIVTDAGPDKSVKISTSSGNFGSAIANAPYYPDSAFHLYRVEVKGNSIKLYIDGGLKLNVNDNTNLTGGQVGFWSFGVQLDISSFKIIAL